MLADLENSQTANYSKQAQCNSSLMYEMKKSQMRIGIFAKVAVTHKTCVPLNVPAWWSIKSLTD